MKEWFSEQDLHHSEKETERNFIRLEIITVSYGSLFVGIILIEISSGS
jgi:hypothetical protein